MLRRYFAVQRKKKRYLRNAAAPPRLIFLRPVPASSFIRGAYLRASFQSRFHEITLARSSEITSKWSSAEGYRGRERTDWNSHCVCMCNVWARAYIRTYVRVCVCKRIIIFPGWAIKTIGNGADEKINVNLEKPDAARNNDRVFVVRTRNLLQLSWYERGRNSTCVANDHTSWTSSSKAYSRTARRSLRNEQSFLQEKLRPDYVPLKYVF